MLFLIAIFIALAIAFCLDKPLKKYPAAFYVTAVVLTVASVFVSQSDIVISSRFVRDYILGIFSRGALGTAFWVIVMWAGALPNGSASIKKLMPIRGELSITAAILTFSHIITYGMQYITNLINGRTGTGSAFRDFVITSIVCLAMVLIMTPLTVMSFKKIRKKMNPKTWKKIQRLAYIFYACIYIHILVLFVPKAQKGMEGYFLSILVYSAVFIGYAVMRIRKYYIINKKLETKAIINAICAGAFVIPLAITGVFSRSNTDAGKVVTVSEEKAATFTFAPSTTVVTEAATTTASGGKQTTSTTSVAGTTAKTTSTESVSTKVKDEKTISGEEEKQEEKREEQEHNDEPEQEQHEDTPVTEPQPSYKYRNGEYEGEAEGYAGKVHVKLSIENDTITRISAWADDDDPDYFDDAMNTVIPQIGSKVSADGIDACSGATYSSNGIIEAARKALEQAMN